MYRFKAKVIPGRRRGRRIGFPTANLNIVNLLFAHGVYLVKVTLDNKIEQGLMHYGPKKTFNEEISREIYLKNFNENIYGRTLAVEVIKKIRDIRKFAGPEELKKQITKDLQELDRED